MNDLDKLTQEQLITLPLPLQEAIKAVPWRESIKGIGASNGLDVDKIKTLETETLLIIYCFEPQENFKANLLRELALDEKTVNTLIKEIEAEVFSPILVLADSLESLIPSKPELEIDLPKPEVLIPAHTKSDESVINIEPEKEHKNINLIEEKPVPVPEHQKLDEVEKPKEVVPPIQTETPKNIIEEHLAQPVTATSKYVGGIDPYREPLA